MQAGSTFIVVVIDDVQKILDVPCVFIGDDLVNGDLELRHETGSNVNRLAEHVKKFQDIVLARLSAKQKV